MTGAPVSADSKRDGPWQIISWVCLLVVVGSLSACLVVAALHSQGLREVRVLVLDPQAEIRDHNLPLVKQREALPDYEVVVLMTDGRKRRLGSKPNTSAAEELSWKLAELAPLRKIASVQLTERGMLGHGAIAEVHAVDQEAIHNGYRFRFETERSYSVGVEAFFSTTLGMAIAAAFFLAVLLMLVQAGFG